MTEEEIINDLEEAIVESLALFADIDRTVAATTASNRPRFTVIQGGAA